MILSLKVAYAGNMRNNIPHLYSICRIYAPHILLNSTYFSAHFDSKSSAH